MEATGRRQKRCAYCGRYYEEEEQNKGRRRTKQRDNHHIILTFLDVLIFTRTKHRARRVGQQLEKASYRAASLQGNLSQNRRQAALNGFRDGSYQVLVATDIAARGIDVSCISHVINYDMPDTTDACTHRIGRTGVNMPALAGTNGCSLLIMHLFPDFMVQFIWYLF